MRLLDFTTRIFKLTSADTSKEQDKTTTHLKTGQLGEHYAAKYLQELGYRLVASNFKIPVGRNIRGMVVNAEIDIIGYEESTLCFVEVKTRTSDWFMTPEVNVDLRKQRQIIRAARGYRKAFGLLRAKFRYDVVSVVINPTEAHDDEQSPNIELIRNFWTEDKFRKRSWTSSYYMA
jgi:putative endonuclease